MPQLLLHNLATTWLDKAWRLDDRYNLCCFFTSVFNLLVWLNAKSYYIKKDWGWSRTVVHYIWFLYKMLYLTPAFSVLTLSCFCMLLWKTTVGTLSKGAYSPWSENFFENFVSQVQYCRCSTFLLINLVWPILIESVDCLFFVRSHNLRYSWRNGYE